MIHLGASGSGYNDWGSSLYSTRTPKRAWALYYAHGLSACEIDSASYALPGPSTPGSTAKETGEGFPFAVKANQHMTREQRDSEEVFESSQEVPTSPIDRGKTGCALGQFPYSFGFTLRNRHYLGTCKERPGDLPIAVGCRNGRWLREDVFGWLRRNEFGFCRVDDPQLPNLLPPVTEAPSKIACVRITGATKTSRGSTSMPVKGMTALTPQKTLRNGYQRPATWINEHRGPSFSPAITGKGKRSRQFGNQG